MKSKEVLTWLVIFGIASHLVIGSPNTTDYGINGEESRNIVKQVRLEKMNAQNNPLDPNEYINGPGFTPTKLFSDHLDLLQVGESNPQFSTTDLKNEEQGLSTAVTPITVLNDLSIKNMNGDQLHRSPGIKSGEMGVDPLQENEYGLKNITPSKTTNSSLLTPNTQNILNFVKIENRGSRQLNNPKPNKIRVISARVKPLNKPKTKTTIKTLGSKNTKKTKIKPRAKSSKPKNKETPKTNKNVKNNKYDKPPSQTGKKSSAVNSSKPKTNEPQDVKPTPQKSAVKSAPKKQAPKLIVTTEKSPSKAEAPVKEQDDAKKKTKELSKVEIKKKLAEAKIKQMSQAKKIAGEEKAILDKKIENSPEVKLLQNKLKSIADNLTNNYKCYNWDCVNKEMIDPCFKDVIENPKGPLSNCSGFIGRLKDMPKDNEVKPDDDSSTPGAKTDTNVIKIEDSAEKKTDDDDDNGSAENKKDGDKDKKSAEKETDSGNDFKFCDNSIQLNEKRYDYLKMNDVTFQSVTVRDLDERPELKAFKNMMILGDTINFDGIMNSVCVYKVNAKQGSVDLYGLKRKPFAAYEYLSHQQVAQKTNTVANCKIQSETMHSRNDVFRIAIAFQIVEAVIEMLNACMVIESFNTANLSFIDPFHLRLTNFGNAIKVCTTSQNILNEDNNAKGFLSDNLAEPLDLPVSDKEKEAAQKFEDLNKRKKEDGSPLKNEQTDQEIIKRLAKRKANANIREKVKGKTKNIIDDFYGFRQDDNIKEDLKSSLSMDLVKSNYLRMNFVRDMINAIKNIFQQDTLLEATKNQFNGCFQRHIDKDFESLDNDTNGNEQKLLNGVRKWLSETYILIVFNFYKKTPQKGLHVKDKSACAVWHRNYKKSMKIDDYYMATQRIKNVYELQEELSRYRENCYKSIRLQPILEVATDGEQGVELKQISKDERKDEGETEDDKKGKAPKKKILKASRSLFENSYGEDFSNNLKIQGNRFLSQHNMFLPHDFMEKIDRNVTNYLNGLI